jgi:hypothetical protein
LGKEAMEEMERYRREMRGNVVLLKHKEVFDDQAFLSASDAEGMKQDFVWDGKSV